jgi:NADH-quinone oxidoreductase subunit J
MLLASTPVAQNVSFGIIAALMVFGAFRVVTTRNVVHAALWLVLVLGGSAAQYILLSAEFVAGTQVLVYIGAVVVLFLFGTMLTRSKLGHELDLDNPGMSVIGFLVAAVLGGTLTWALVDAYHADKLPDGSAQLATATVQNLSDSIFGQYLLPFWALSFVLLAALVGAIVLAKRD